MKNKKVKIVISSNWSVRMEGMVNEADVEIIDECWYEVRQLIEDTINKISVQFNSHLDPLPLDGVDD